MRFGQGGAWPSGLTTPCAAATDAAIGVALEPANAGENVPVAILGNYTGTVEVLAGGAVSRGAQLGATGATAASGNTTIGSGKGR